MASRDGKDFEWDEHDDDDDEPGSFARKHERREARLRAAAMEVKGCVAAYSRRLSRNMMLRYKQHLKPHCITVTELQVLVEIWLRPRVTAAALSAILELDKSTVSRIVERMGENNWVVNTESEDARATPLLLQYGAEDRLMAALRAWREAHHCVVGWLGDDVSCLKRLASRVRPPINPPRCSARCGER